MFFLSLEKCTEGEDNCSMKIKWIKIKVIEELISCILTVILAELIILKLISKLHLLHFTVVYYLFYAYSHGINFDNHGYYNIKYFFIIVASFIIVIILLNCIIFSKKNKILLVYIFSIIILLFLTKKLLYNFANCKNWELGLNNTYIDNDKKKYGCLIKLPKFCPFKIGRQFFDKFPSLDCTKKRLTTRLGILRSSKSPFINNKTLNFGFPLTNQNEKFFFDMDYDTFMGKVFEHYIDMNNLTLLNLLKDKRPEINIDFSDNEDGKMSVNLNFNHTLSIERKELEKFTTPYSNNILILYLDSVSRANSLRQLKKTLKFFERFMPYGGNRNSKYPKENFHSFQFFKYHSHKYFTIGNYPLIFYGNHRNSSNKHINLYLKRNGYVTGYSADICFNDFVKSYHKFTFEDIYDHQYINCDPNFRVDGHKYTCLYGKLDIEYLLEYINQFWEKYQNNRKFSMILTNFAHEGTLEKLKYIDNLIYKFFYNLFNKNLLKETSVFFLSDHGVALPSVYYMNDFFKYERALPMFYLLVNDRKNVSYEFQYKYLYKNQQTFITGFDIYNTILNLIYGDKFGKEENKESLSKYGKSLFTEINQIKRSPKNYINMEDYICT